MLVYLINITFISISLLLFFFSPENYNYAFCYGCFAVFLSHSLLHYITKKDKDLFSFEFIFGISFLATNFIYPLFLYQFNSDFSIYAYQFNEAVISKSTALATLAYSFFLTGLSIKDKPIDAYKNLKPKSTVNIRTLNIAILLNIVVFLVYIYLGGLDAMRDQYSGDEELFKNGTHIYLLNIFYILTLLTSILVFYTNKTIGRSVPYLAIIAVFLLLMLTTGSRTLVLASSLMLIYGFHRNIRKLSGITLIILMAIGITAMYVIVVVRSSDVTTEGWQYESKYTDIFFLWRALSDLIINNRNLYVLVDFVDNHTPMYFVNYISEFCSPVPGLFSFVKNMINVPEDFITGGALPTYLEFGSGSAFGLGTNLVGEAYLTLGVVGVMVAFFFIGYFIQYLKQKSYSSNIAYVLFLFFMSHSVMYNRAPLIYDPRTLIWGITLFQILKSAGSLSYSKKIKR